MTYPKDVRTAVVGAYYPRAVAAADAARTRAQSAYAIASAVAAALVAAGILTDIGDRPEWVQILGLAALAAWLVTAVLFMAAVAEPVQLTLPARLPDADHFIDAVLENVRQERAALEGRLGPAIVGTKIAVLLTVVAFLLVLFVPEEATTTNVSVVLNDKGAASIEALCGTSAITVTGQVDLSTLAEKYVPVTLNAESCGGQSMTVRLPQRYVVAVGEHAEAEAEPGTG
jgi:MFS family permease